MPGWSEVLEEIQVEQSRIDLALQQNPHDPALTRHTGADIVRRKYLAELSAYTGRNTIIYASGWLQKPGLPGDFIIVHPSDMDGFLEVVRACDKSKPLDLMLHSPGGSPEAAEQIVNYLRQKFSDIRVIVPNMAMSAATMIACAADTIMLARHSTLGPTDPQMAIRTNTGEIRLVPAHALKADFEAAKLAAASAPNTYAAWAPILGQYPPGLLTQCESALKLTKRLMTVWLRSYMFKGEKRASEKAGRLAKFFADAKHFTHGRPLMRDQLRKNGLKVNDLEVDNKLQDLVMSVYHATTHTLGGTIAAKIIDSHAGKGYFKQFRPPQQQTVLRVGP